jgi:uncharacterized metal-binding protein
MPSGQTHLVIEMLLLCGLAALGAVAAASGRLPSREVAAFLGAYLGSSLLLSPDLDLARSDVSRRWGPLRIVWMPYACLFRHRRMSHRPLLGPLSRIAYLAVVAAAIGAVVQLAIGRPLRIARIEGQVLTAVALGVYAPNLLHILLDRTHSWWRRCR